MDVGLVAGVVKRETSPTEKSVIWAKVINAAFPDVTELHYYDKASTIWKPFQEQIKKYPVQEVGLNTPPVSPNEGDSYIVGITPTGAWVGRANSHALYLGGIWNYTTPFEGAEVVELITEKVQLWHYKTDAPGWVMFSGGEDNITGTENNATRFDSNGDLVETDELQITSSSIDVKTKLKMLSGASIELGEFGGNTSFLGQLADSVFFTLLNTGIFTANDIIALDAPDININGNLNVSGELSIIGTNTLKILINSLSEDRVLQAPDKDGTIALTSDIIASGIVEGGNISINSLDNTTFDVSDGSLVKVDEFTTPGTPIIYTPSWSGLEGITVTNLATSTVTFVYLDNNGAVYQSTSPPDAVSERDYTYLGQLGHSDNATIQTAIIQKRMSQSPIDQLRDLYRAIGGINEGNKITANGANLSIDKSSGNITALSINSGNSEKDSNRLSFTEQILATIRMRTQAGGTGTTTVLDVGNYDDGGVITNITGNKVQNMRCYLLDSGNIVVQYGQVLYNSLDLAIEGINEEVFVELENVKNGSLRAIISVQSNCTSLEDDSRAYIKNLGKFSQLNSNLEGSVFSSINSILPLSDTAGTVDMDDNLLSQSPYRKVTATGNIILNATTLESTTETKEWVLEFTQDSIGGHNITFGTNFLFPGGAAPVVSSSPNATDNIIFQTDSLGKYRLKEHRKDYK